MRRARSNFGPFDELVNPAPAIDFLPYRPILKEPMRHRTERPAAEQPRLYAPEPPRPEYREPEAKPATERGVAVIDFFI
jgi:hypothetical protein